VGVGVGLSVEGGIVSLKANHGLAMGAISEGSTSPALEATVVRLVG